MTSIRPVPVLEQSGWNICEEICFVEFFDKDQLSTSQVLRSTISEIVRANVHSSMSQAKCEIWGEIATKLPQLTAQNLNLREDNTNIGSPLNQEKNRPETPAVDVTAPSNISSRPNTSTSRREARVRIERKVLEGLRSVSKEPKVQMSRLAPSKTKLAHLNTQIDAKLDISKELQNQKQQLQLFLQKVTTKFKETDEVLLGLINAREESKTEATLASFTKGRLRFGDLIELPSEFVEEGSVCVCREGEGEEGEMVLLGIEEGEGKLTGASTAQEWRPVGRSGGEGEREGEGLGGVVGEMGFGVRKGEDGEVVGEGPLEGATFRGGPSETVAESLDLVGEG